MGEKLDAFETTLCLILKLYSFSNINSEQKFLFHISSFIFKLIIACFRSDEDRHGSLSKNLTHLVTTVFQAIIQYNQNTALFLEDLYNFFSFIITALQDLFFIFHYQEQKEQLQKQKQKQRQEHMA
ncbi:hypothetical protein ACTFIR_005478 [Dictyostelium discoideum]